VDGAWRLGDAGFTVDRYHFILRSRGVREALA